MAETLQLRRERTTLTPVNDPGLLSPHPSASPPSYLNRYTHSRSGNRPPLITYCFKLAHRKGALNFPRHAESEDVSR